MDSRSRWTLPARDDVALWARDEAVGAMKERDRPERCDIPS
jgi:hypothetical protein